MDVRVMLFPLTRGEEAERGVNLVCVADRWRFQTAADLALAEIDRQESHVDAAKQRLAAIVAADSRNIPALLMLAWALPGHGGVTQG